MTFRQTTFVLFLAAILPLPPLLAAAADMRLLRETEALSPDQELAKLSVPDGFEIQLFAAEPMIHKPVNMAFDERGRLWVSSTVEYPYSADKRRWSDAKGSHVEGSRDAIKILEDTDGDGRADKVIDFADQLNIPTGVLPWHKPEHKAGCIAWSIPNIWYFADTDGDDKADLREVLFGPLGFEKDTHGMCSSFRLGLDGWVYATHGFNNTSHFKARDGSTLALHSGNVFRFRPDGSRVEPWTWGQVNPFGLCWDRSGNLYSADCHSAPIYQLIRGAHYPSFGKPHDGLGYAPVMCAHTHGSTGICGVVYLDGGVWGPGWDDHMFVGNVVTSRINLDRITRNGSTPKAAEQADFLTSEDPWFRPIDLQLGPDNALYIADFYNRIIGHYEVALDHPGRDRERGRIWRVMRKGIVRPPTNFASMDAKALAAEMESPNLTRVRLALGEVKRRGNRTWVQAFLDFLGTEDERQPLVPRGDARPVNWKEGDGPHDANTRYWPKRMTVGTAHALWACSYLGERAVVFDVLRGLLSGGGFVVDRKVGESDVGETPFGLVMSQAVRVLGSYEQFHPWEMAWLSFVFDRRGWPAGRAAAEALLGRPDYLIPGANEAYGFRGHAVVNVLNLYQGMLSPRNPDKPQPWENPGDTHFIHALRLLIRDFWSQPGVLEDPLVKRWLGEGLRRPDSRQWILATLTAVPTPEAASFLLDRLQAGEAGDNALWTHIGRHAEAGVLTKALALMRDQTQGDDALHVKAIESFHNGLSERGAPPNAELLGWARAVAQRLLERRGQMAAPAWESMPHASLQPVWSLVPRACADGREALVLQSINQGGGEEEQRTGVLRSLVFTVPTKLHFWINGHRGFPKAAAHDRNAVRLLEDGSGEVLATVFPPRNDRCQPVEWNLTKHVGKRARLEIVDGDSGRAYAWLGITRIDPPVVSVEGFRSESAAVAGLRVLAPIIARTAPSALRAQLAAYLPQRPPPPPLPVSAEQRRQLDALIAARAAAVAKGKANLANGQRVFAAHCAGCHQMRGSGNLVGPQLDGVSHRGVERLCEDILDPNRNVDAHFHLHALTLKDARTIGGFLKGETGQVLIMVDATGAEHRLGKDQVVKDEVLPVSLMPPVFGQTIGAQDFLDLMGWLMGR